MCSNWLHAAGRRAANVSVCVSHACAKWLPSSVSSLFQRYAHLPPTSPNVQVTFKPQKMHQPKLNMGVFCKVRCFSQVFFVEHKWLRQTWGCLCVFVCGWGGAENVNISVMAKGYSCPPSYLSTSLRGQLSD